jgi:hypothetical protein
LSFDHGSPVKFMTVTSDLLAQLPLKWLMDKAGYAGLVFRDQVVIDTARSLRPPPTPTASSHTASIAWCLFAHFEMVLAVGSYSAKWQKCFPICSERHPLGRGRNMPGHHAIIDANAFI